MNRPRSGPRRRGEGRRGVRSAGVGSVRVIAGDLRGLRLRVPSGVAIRPTSDRLREALFSSQGGLATYLIAVSAALIFVALLMLVRVMRSVVQSRVETFITGVLGSSATLAILVGAVVTVMVQSSSITTSLLVPLAGAGLLRLEQAFPITIGANIGTTVTALLAALALSGPNATAGVEIAVVHLLFNLSGTILVYPIQAVRRLPLRAATRLAEVAVESRKVALLYVAVLFYGVPALLIFLSRVLG